MKVVKWNDRTKSYGTPFEVDTTTYCLDMNRVVQCPRCLGKTTFGESINAGDYFTVNGLWRICICPKCAEEVWAEEKARRDKMQREDE